MKKLKTVLCLALALTLICSAALAAPTNLIQSISAPATTGSQGILYRVTNGVNEMYLLGSIHIGSEDMYPMGKHITDAIENADTLVFECDVDDSAALALTMRMMYYPLGDSLQKNVSETTWSMVQQLADKYGYDVSAFNTMEPWGVVNALSLESVMVEFGTSDPYHAIELGVETQVELLGEGKERAYLETVEEQLRAMDELSTETQEFLLVATCNELLFPEVFLSMDGGVGDWPTLWYEGDADMFAYLMGGSMEPKEYYDALLTNRNIKMAQGLKKMLDGEYGTDKSYFVTIGLLHLVLPDDSVIVELEKLGYQVERVMQE